MKIFGAIIGDIVGSVFEFYNTCDYNFELFSERSRPTDDSIMTLAVSDWLVENKNHTKEFLVESMQILGKCYPRSGYGRRFRDWLFSDNPRPYNSFGNGSAMRVSPVGLYARSLEESLELAKISAEVSHNHPEGIKGAQAVASSIYLLRSGKTKEEVLDYVKSKFGYNIKNQITYSDKFDETCQGSLPIAFSAFWVGKNFEDVLRLAISSGGDSDTIACIACSLASCLYEVPEDIATKCYNLLDEPLQGINDNFFEKLTRKD